MKQQPSTLGEQLADKVASTLGSWKFVGYQIVIVFLWAGLNAIPKTKIDPYPYSFLNLILGLQAALTGPVLLIAGNRQEEMDRRRAIENLELDKMSYEDLKKISRKIEEIEKDLESLG